MSARAWDEGLRTGVDAIDAEHRLQVSLVNALEQMIRRGERGPRAEKTLTQLVDFTAVHFVSEELMMRLYGYPERDAHELEHARLRDQVAEIQRRVESREEQPALEALGRLHAWTTDHIRTMDRSFGLWCSNQGIRAR